MRNSLLVSVAVCLVSLGNVYGQENAHGQVTAYGQEGGRFCADLPGQTSGTHRFARLGETIEIPLRDDLDGGRVDGSGVNDRRPASQREPAGVECEPVALDLHWSNGGNNGSNFYVTFLDSGNRPIYTKSFSGFLNGNLQFDLSSDNFRRAYSSTMTVISVPASVTVKAVSPFAAPVGLSFMVTRVARAARARGKEEEGNGEKAAESARNESAGNVSEGNEVVSIRNVVRLIGASKLPVVQIELKTAHPFPIKDAPLQLQIGKKVFIDELSGDYTGRRLTLSLTPEMFAELQDGDEIVASFPKTAGSETADQVWRFGKLVKQTANSRQQTAEQ